jgi:4-hydroxyphenylpyruvate dioxygenase-like putative hemolysin
MHSGDLTFILKSTQDKKHWAFFLEGHPTRIYAVAEILDEGNVVMEKVAAGMMSVYTEHEGVYIECFDTIGEVDLALLYDLYNHYNEKNRQIDKPPEG